MLLTQTQSARMISRIPEEIDAVSQIQLAKPLRPDILTVGEERTPVVIIDDVLDSLESMAELAAGEDFTYDHRFSYPGQRTRLPPEYASVVLPELQRLIAEIYSPPESTDFQLVHEFYSLITLRPEELVHLQRVPHFDTLLPWYFATVHFLNPGTYAGTGLFRHRPTGFERISEARYPAFVEAAQAHVSTHGWPEAGYIKESDEHFEMIAELEYKPNRLVLYPGNLLHSGLIEPDRDISADPVKGRLTANLFLNYVVPS